LPEANGPSTAKLGLFRFQSFTGFAMLSDNIYSPIKTRNAAAGEALATIKATLNIVDMKNSKQNVRPLKLTSVSTILFLFFFPFNSICQSVSTISEIYNYEINDIFHTSESGYNAMYGGFQQYSNIQIVNKFYSPGNDTLNYICDVKTVYS
jgi:hypothetical protein